MDPSHSQRRPAHLDLRRMPRASALCIASLLSLASGFTAACGDGKSPTQLHADVGAADAATPLSAADAGRVRAADAAPSRVFDASVSHAAAPVQDAQAPDASPATAKPSDRGQSPDMRQRPAIDDHDDAGEPTAPSGSGLPRLSLLRTEYVGQLTGRAPNRLENLGMLGTDLGVSFERQGKLVFLFGDSDRTSNFFDTNLDSLAEVPLATTPLAVPQLTWRTRPDGTFLPLRVAGINTDRMNVPVEGLSLEADSYLFFATDWSELEHRHARSVLAHAPAGDYGNLKLDHVVASEKFIVVSVIAEGDDLWIWGTGAYRKSPIYLARTTRQGLKDRASWRYYAGDAGWAVDETSAKPVIAEPCVGEFSARKHPTLGLYVLAYGCFDTDLAVQLSVARTPTGPWSAPLRIFEQTDGYQHFMHASSSKQGYDDGLAEDGREDEPGGSYGPYLIPAWFSEPALGVHELVYTLSSWNPYQVQLLRSVLTEPGASFSPALPGAGLPRAHLDNPRFDAGKLDGWHAEGDPFSTVRDAAGNWLVNTYTDRGDAAVGKLWQEFMVDAQTSTLGFEVLGGHGAVTLYVDGEPVRRTRAKNSNDARVKALWSLQTLRGKTVRLAIEDNATDAWGFISVGGFELH